MKKREESAALRKLRMGLHPVRNGWFVGRMTKVQGFELLEPLSRDEGLAQPLEALQQQPSFAGLPMESLPHMQESQAEDDYELSLSRRRGFFGEDSEWM